jgi:hypothetical protein
MPIDFETLPIMLKVGVKLDSDLNHMGQPPILLHLDRLKADRF